MLRRYQWLRHAILGLLGAFSVLTATTSYGSTVCAWGDWGTGTRNQYEVAEAALRFGCTDILLLGDNFYPEGVSSTTDPLWESHFRRPYAALLASGVRFHVALGNHDYIGNAQAQIDYSQVEPLWNLPARYHAFQIEDACFAAVDTNDLDEDQAAWLSDTLTTQGCRWRIAFGHHPVKSSGYHGDTGGDVETILRPALGAARAQLYLSGHDHQFSDEGNFLTEPEDTASPQTRQLVVGTGGTRLRWGFCRTEDCRHYEKDHGFLHLNWNDNEMSFTFYRVDGSAAYVSGI